MRRREMGGKIGWMMEAQRNKSKFNDESLKKKVKPFNCPVPRGKNERG